MAAVQHLLLQEQVGLLTLTGPGGIGKTRLAMQVAANLLDHFVDGVYFVSLASISDLALVIPAIAQVLGVREAGPQSLLESLQAYLRDRQLLLVLDNFEQVVAAAPLVGDLLANCHRLKTLVTSGATLHLYGEHEFRVPPLALPGPKHIPTVETDLVTSLTHYAAEAIALGRETGDKLTLSFALGMQSKLLLTARGDLAAARAGGAESARLARETGKPSETAQAVMGLAGIAAYAGEWDEARTHIREALALFRQLGDHVRVNAAYSDLAHIERRAGNLEEARQLYQQTIVVWQEFGQRAAIAHQLECFAFLARVQDQLVRAARLFGAAETLRAALDSRRTTPEEDEYDREVTALHAQLEAETAAAQWATGRTMTMDQAIAYALAAGEVPEPGPTLVEPHPVIPPPPTYPAGLTTREVEVLRLLAHGLTYVQIAEKLIITRRTVNGHVTSIYSKLGVTTRVAATRFAVEHHLV